MVPPQKKALFIVQGLTLLVESLAIVFGIAAVCSVAFPGPSGEWASMGVLFASLVDIPAGILGLIVGFAVKQGHPTLRRFVIIGAIVALCLPFLAELVHKYNADWKYSVERIVEVASHAKAENS